MTEPAPASSKKESDKDEGNVITTVGHEELPDLGELGSWSAPAKLLTALSQSLLQKEREGVYITIYGYVAFGRGFESLSIPMELAQDMLLMKLLSEYCIHLSTIDVIVKLFSDSYAAEVTLMDEKTVKRAMQNGYTYEIRSSAIMGLPVYPRFKELVVCFLTGATKLRSHDNSLVYSTVRFKITLEMQCLSENSEAFLNSVGVKSVVKEPPKCSKSYRDYLRSFVMQEWNLGEALEKFNSKHVKDTNILYETVDSTKPRFAWNKQGRDGFTVQTTEMTEDGPKYNQPKTMLERLRDKSKQPAKIRKPGIKRLFFKGT